MAEVHSPTDPPFDQRSLEGKFSWLDDGGVGVSLPQLSRVGPDRSPEEYVSVKMLEKILLESPGMKVLPRAVAALPEWFKVPVSVNESKLLADINSNHCDLQFGQRENFGDDYLVRTTDAIEYFHYLAFCLNRMLSQEADGERCGFLTVSETHEMAFVTVAGSVYIPVFYLEEKPDPSTWTVISGWDWAFLRFCCLLQRISQELLSGSGVVCVEMTELTKLLPLSSTFRTFWPDTGHFKHDEERDKYRRQLKHDEERDKTRGQLKHDEEKDKYRGQLKHNEERDRYRGQLELGQKDAQRDRLTALVLNPAFLPLPERSAPGNEDPKAILSWLLQLKEAPPAEFRTFTRRLDNIREKTVTKVRFPQSLSHLSTIFPIKVSVAALNIEAYSSVTFQGYQDMKRLTRESEKKAAMTLLRGDRDQQNMNSYLDAVSAGSRELPSVADRRHVSASTKRIQKERINNYNNVKKIEAYKRSIFPGGFEVRVGDKQASQQPRTEERREREESTGRSYY